MATRLILEWTRASVRLALAEGEGATVRLRALYSRPVDAPEQLPEIARRLLASVRIGSPFIVSVVPREQVITRTVKFPSADPAELSAMVELYAKAQLPYPRDEVVMDAYTISQEHGSTIVTIVACPREFLNRHLAVLRELRLTPALVTVTTWGVAVWRARTRPEPPEAPELLINLDDTRTDFVLMRSGRVLSSRSLGQGVQDWESDQAVGVLADEVERSRVAVRRELPGLEIHGIVLTGLGALLEAWAAALAQRLGVPVGVADAKDPLGPGFFSLEAPASPVVVGGLARGALGEILNLTPPELRLEARHRRQVRELVLVGALCAAALGLGAGVLAGQLLRHRAAGARLEQALHELGPAAKQLQEETRSAAIVSAAIADRQRLAGMLSGIFRVTTPEIQLGGVAFERARRELLVRGSAGSTQAVFAYIAQLQGIDEIGEVALKYSTRRSTPLGDRTDFELILQERLAR